MSNGNARVRRWAFVLAVCVGVGAAFAAGPTTRPDKVYVPYKDLKGVFDSEKAGVFLPYRQLQALWRKARGVPADAVAAPAPYLISTARFRGQVDAELASLQLELTVDILADGWVSVPIGLGDVAVSKVGFGPAGDAKGPAPLLRVVGGKYHLLTKGKGRRILVLDFVRQLVTQPGLNVLSFRIPAAAITTLELTIPEENMKVDVEPMLAASTDQVDFAGKKATRLRAFLGSATSVKLSWKPKTQAAAELAPVVISSQLQHVHVDEALVSHQVTFTYDIRRRGVDAFTVQLPKVFRVTAVEGANISKWDIAAAGAAAVQNLQVSLFSRAKGTYTLTVKMERFLKERQVKLALTPIVTQQVLRRTGLVAVTHSPRRSVELTDAKGLARVDTGRLPASVRKRPGVTAWRFITADYGATLDIGTVEPRITAHHLWALGVDSDRLELHGKLQYTIERAGLFQLSLNLPEPWEIVSLGPDSLVDDYKLTGNGRDRAVGILLKREVTGSITLTLVARALRAEADAPVRFDLPLADAKHLRLYSGQLMLLLAGRLRAEVDSLQQLQPLPLNRANTWASIASLGRVMAFEFRSIDRTKPAAAAFKIAVKPSQVSATVHRLVSIQAGSIEQEARIDYDVLYAPVDTFYVQMPASLADQAPEITGRDIKEKPRLDALPPDQRPKAPAATQPGLKWAYYKIVLQSPVLGRYRATVKWQRSFSIDSAGKKVEVVPVLAAGKLSHQTGYVAIAKAETLGLGEPTLHQAKNGTSIGTRELPEPSHRRAATLAFKYHTPPFALTLPVAAQKEAAVFTTIATGAVIEQVLARDGTLNTRATFLLATSRGGRLPVTLPKDASTYAVLINGEEAPIETDAQGRMIVRLAPSAGQVAKIVLEIEYGLKSGSRSRLAAPALPKDVPVQQTLWRLWVPDQDRLLWFDSVFSRLAAGQADQLLGTLAAGQPAKVDFKLPPQGRARDFVRQGPPGELHVLLMGREALAIVVWAVFLIGGAAALKLGGFHRCLLVLLAALVLIVLRLFAPLLVRQIVVNGYWAVLIVLGLWLAHWIFRYLPRHVRRREKSPPGAPPTLDPAGAAAPPPRPQTPAETPPASPQAPDTPDRGDQDKE